MGEVLNTIGQLRKNWTKYEKWEQEQDILEQQKIEYRKKHPVSEKEKREAQQLGRTIINAIDVMDQYAEDKAEDMEAATESIKIIPVEIASVLGAGIGGLAGYKIAKGKYMPLMMMLGSLISGIAAYIPVNVIATKAQIWTSKVARYQAINKELQGLDKFTMYTPEQLEQARKIAATMPDEEEKESKVKKLFPIVESIETLRSINKDKMSYKEWRKKYEAEKNQIKVSYKQGIPTNQEQKARKDQQILKKTIWEIEKQAEEYSENVESATETAGFFVSAAVLAAVGTATNFVMNRFKISPTSFIGTNKKFVSLVAGIIPSLGVATYFASLQKKASRVGRFKAKEKLLSEADKHFTYVDEEKMKSEVNEKNIRLTKKKGIFGGIAQNTRQLIDYVRKDLPAYKKHKKTEAKQEKKLRKALEKIETTEEQKQAARNLQKKTFNAFEIMDDNMQKYSETAEMMTDIAKDTVPSVAALGAVGAGIGLFVYVKKKLKNLTPAKLVEKAINVYDKVTKNKILKSILERPFVKKFLNKTLEESIEVGGSLFEKGKRLSLGNILIEAVKKPGLREIAIGAGIPVLAAFTGSLYAMYAYFTNLQKKAGKIGIMKAMEELKDPRYFVDKYQTEQSGTIKQQKTSSKLKRLMQLRNNAA